MRGRENYIKERNLKEQKKKTGATVIKVIEPNLK